MKLDKWWSGLYSVVLTEKEETYTIKVFMNGDKAHRFLRRINKKYNYALDLTVEYLILPKHKNSRTITDREFIRQPIKSIKQWKKNKKDKGEQNA